MLDWAERQLKALEADHAAFMRKKPYALFGKDHAESGERFVLVCISVAEHLQPIPDLSLRVGDVLHNLRVSLDYVAAAVARRVDPSVFKDKKRFREVAFPIIEDAKDWSGTEGRLKAWADAPAIGAFETLQPYTRPFLANLDPLLLLHKLDNPHKHRELIAAAPNISGIDFRMNNSNGTLVPVSFGLEGPFKDGAVVGRYRRVVPKPGDPIGLAVGLGMALGLPVKAGVETIVGFEIMFDQSTAAPAMPVFALLHQMADFIGDVVFPVMEDHI